MARKRNTRALLQAAEDASKKQARLDAKAAAAIEAQEISKDQDELQDAIDDEDEELYGDFEDVEGKDETTSQPTSESTSNKRTATQVLDEALKTSKKPKREDPLYSVPTSEELSELKDTQELFKSNLFKLQLSELLNEVSVSYDSLRPLESYLHTLKSTLDTLTSQDISLPVTHKLCSFYTTHPMIHEDQSHDTHLNFQFTPPSRIDLIGSYLLRTTSQPVTNIDIAIEMNSKMFQEKDYLDYRYYDRRAAWLHTLHDQLSTSSHITSTHTTLSFAGFRGDPLKPVLILHPHLLQSYESTHTEHDTETIASLRACKRFIIRLIPCISHQTFAIKKLHPSRNNVRSHKLVHQHQQPISTSISTPLYNNSILEDMYYRDHMQEMHTHLHTHESVQHAIILLKVWLRQRGMGGGIRTSTLDIHAHAPGGGANAAWDWLTTSHTHSIAISGGDTCNGFILTMIICYLIRIRIISKQMSCYQIVRMTLQWLGNSDLEKGVTMQQEGPITSTITTSLQPYTSVFDVTFMDRSGLLNLTSRISRSSYHELRDEARRSLSYLDNPHRDGFDSVFMSPILFTYMYDVFLRIPLPKAWTTHGSVYIQHPTMDPLASYTRQIHYLLSRACTNRVTRIGIRTDIEKAVIRVGMCIDVQHAFRAIDVGPAAEDKAGSDAFRQFWGPRSELRRFRDGSIVEAVVWEHGNTNESDTSIIASHHIVEECSKHILHRHLKIAPDSIGFVGNQFDSLLLLRPTPSSPPSIDPMISIPSIHTIFKQLMSMIRSLDDVPLTITSIRCIHPLFRSTSVFPPQPIDHPTSTLSSTLEPLPVIITFESSSRWPEDLSAISRIKCAFYIRIAQSLENKYHITSVVSVDSVDVMMNGYAWRIKIWHEKEHAIRLADEKAGLKPMLMGNVDPAIAEYDLYHRPTHSLTIRTFTSTYPLFAPITRLCHRWITSHMMSHIICLEAIELMVVYICLHSEPYQSPTSMIQGLLRFLHLLSTWDWENHALIIDVNNDMTPAIHTVITDRFIDARSRHLSGAPMYLATVQDPGSKLWTHVQPDQHNLKRLITLAHASHHHLSTCMSSCGSIPASQFKITFKTPMDGYHLIIHLDSSQLTTSSRQQSLIADKNVIEDNKPTIKHVVKKKTVYKLPPDAMNMDELVAVEDDTPHMDTDIPYIGLQLIHSYLHDLTCTFQHIARFYHDIHGGNIIGVIFRDNIITTPRTFSVHAAAWSQPATPINAPNLTSHIKDPIILNLDEIIVDMKRLGTGLVTDITRNMAATQVSPSQVHTFNGKTESNKKEKVKTSTPNTATAPTSSKKKDKIATPSPSTASTPSSKKNKPKSADSSPPPASTSTPASQKKTNKAAASPKVTPTPAPTSSKKKSTKPEISESKESVPSKPIASTAVKSKSAKSSIPSSAPTKSCSKQSRQ